jgi:sugar lactone lactonase YvrE
MPVSELRPGMKGYGLTVFKGARIERFDVTILGVLPRANMGRPLVLIRMAGGPITGRGAYLIQGMSGSPIYVRDRLVGAFAYGNPYAKEPIGMVTPIQDMMEALDEKLPSQPVGTASLDLLLPPGVAAIAGGYRRLIVGPDEQSLPVGPGTLGMAPLTTPVVVSGFSARGRAAVAEALRPFNLSVQMGGGRMDRPVEPAPNLVPGAGIGVSLISGDMEMTAVGTVTWRKGNRILAFGHPFMQIGPAAFPISTVWVHDVFASYQSAFKIASPVRVAGALVHDRPFSVLAEAGPAPEMVPVSCHIDDQITGRSHTFSVRVANHPLLLGQLAQLAINEAVMEAHPVPGDVTADVRLALDTERFGRLQRENTFYDPVQIEAVATQELGQMLSLLAANNLQRVPVKSLDVNVVLVRRRPTAAIERIFVKQERFEPGETAEVGVVVRPYRGEPVTTRASIRIPENAASGRAVLMVSGGATRLDPAILGLAPGAGNLASSAPGAAHVAQLLRRFLEREKNNQLVTRIIFSTTAVSVDGVRLSQLPSHLAEVMRSSRATGIRIERDEARVADTTPYVLQGVQALPILIQRRELSERPAEAGSVNLPTGGAAAADLSPVLTSGRTGMIADYLDAHLPPPGIPEAAGGYYRPSPEPDEDSAGGRPAPDPAAPPTGARPERGGMDGEKSEPAKRDAPAETAAPAVDNSLLGRQPVTWKQTSLADFQRGNLTGAAVTMNGEVRLAPSLRPLFESDEQYVWSIACADDAVYVGTGNGGAVYRVSADGKATLFFKTGELEVHALAKDGQGNIYAGTGPGGRVFRISRDGQATELLTLTDAPPESLALNGPQPTARYVFALAVAADGTVFAGTGPEGRLYRIPPGGKASLLFTVRDRSIVSLLLGPQGEVYAGTSDDGLVYRIEPDGRGQAILDTDQSAITALARDSAGNLFAAAAPKGTIYRIRPDGAVTTYFDRARSGVHALSMTKGDTLYAACSNLIYRLDSAENVTAISDSKRAQFVAMDWDSQGRLVAASANIGAVYRAEPGLEGSFESTVHDAKSTSRWGRIRWVAIMSPEARFALQTRTGSTPEPDASWSDWSTPRDEPSGSYVTSPAARFIQYRVAMHGQPGAVGLREVSLLYMPRNEPPTLTVAAPVGGEIWRATQTIRWTGADPNRDTLVYSVFYSGDGGATWHPAGEKAAPDVRPDVMPAPAPPAPRAAGSGDDLTLLETALSRYREEILLRSDLSDEARRDLIDQAETLVAGYRQQNPGGAPPKPEKSNAAAAAERKSPPAKPGVTRESSLAWDTTQVPDGIYLVKVVASDRPSNPGEPLSVEKVSEPIIVVNRPPLVFVLVPAVQYTPQNQAVLTGLCQARVALRGAQYRIDEGDWVAIESADGIWDSGLEQWRVVTDPLKPGEHSVQVKTVDAAGNVGLTQVKLSVP